MSPSLTATNNIGILISTTADPAGLDETNAALDETAASLQGVSDAAAETSATITEANAATIDSNKAVVDSYADVDAAAGSSGVTKDLAAGAGIGSIATMVTNPFVLAGAAIALAVKSAAAFQKQLTQLYTTAGETAPLATLQAGIIKISDTVGDSTTQLTQGLYYISSAGYTAASGLDILKAAAEGAKAENADLANVANALTTVMVDFHQPATAATADMNMIITAVSRGKTTLQDFSSALATVLPTAEAAGLSFAQAAGALTTLTAAGKTTEGAAQDVNALIATLTKMTTQQTQAFQQMGLSAVDIAKNLGQEGLTGTLQEMFDAIEAHMGPDGLIIQSAMKNATLATQDLNTELKNSPAELQSLEQQLLNNSISFTSFRTQVRALPEDLTNLGTQFEATYNQAHSFNNQLTAAINASPTFRAELQAMTGQSDALQAALLLTGTHAATFDSNVKAISASSKDAGSNITEWSNVVGNLDTQFDIFVQKIINAAKAIGTLLIPAVTDLLKALNDVGAGVNYVIGGLSRMAQTGEAKSGQNKGFVGNLISDLMPHFASGITNFGGGLALVGESGPELVYLPQGSSVMPNTETGSMMGSSTSSQNTTNNSHTVTIGQVNLSTSAAVTAFITQLDLDNLAVGKGLTASRGIS